MTDLRALQTRLGVAADGDLGPITIAMMNRKLDELAALKAAQAPPKPLGLRLPETPPRPSVRPPEALEGPLQGVGDLQRRLGVTQDGSFGPATRSALFAKLSNKNAPALTEAEIAAVATDLSVDPRMIRAVRKVEAPRGPFDDDGRPSILYERHKFRNASDGRFNASHPALSGPPYGPGGYGSFGAQYGKLADACALDPEAAFKACSWGAFQVLGENAEALGYPSAFVMALALTKSEAAHLDCFARYVKVNGLTDELRACRPGDPKSCEPFVERYNGAGWRQFNYAAKLAEAAR